MFALKAYCVFLLLIHSQCIEAANKYKFKLISLKQCKIAENRLDKTTSADTSISLSARKVDRETTLISANVTVAAKIGPIFLSFKEYQIQQNSAKDLVFKLEMVPCTNPMTFQLIKVLNINISKDCFVDPGTYVSQKINIEDFNWIFTKAMIGLGKYGYDLEFLTAKGVVACISMSCDISEIKQKQ